MAPFRAGWGGSQEVSRRVVISMGMADGEPDVIRPVRMTGSAGETGSRPRVGGLSDAAGEAEPQRGRSFAGRLNQSRGERSMR
jgi:hypothetical protein